MYNTLRKCKFANILNYIGKLKMKFRNIIAGSVLLLVSAFSANASVIKTIDDFSTSQGPISATLTTPGFSSVSGTGIIGGERDLLLEVFADNFSQGATTNVAGNNFFFSSGSGVESQFTIQWDGVDGSSAINPFGLGGVDFGTSSFSFITSVIESDLNAWFDVTFWSGAQGTSETVELPIPGVSAPGRDTFFLTDLFTFTDFTNVGAIQVRGNILSPIDQLRQRSYDLQLSGVTAVEVGAPATLGVLSAGLLGLLVMRRKLV
jgi:hypothetical protein